MIKSVRFFTNYKLLEHNCILSPDIVLNPKYWSMYYPAWALLVLLAIVENES